MPDQPKSFCKYTILEELDKGGFAAIYNLSLECS